MGQFKIVGGWQVRVSFKVWVGFKSGSVGKCVWVGKCGDENDVWTSWKVWVGWEESPIIRSFPNYKIWQVI